MKKKIIGLAFIVYAAVIISACNNPPIFAAIEQEVKLKPASIKSFVYKIVSVNSTLFATNGTLFRKTLGETGKWESISGAGGRCIGLASDNKYLYGLFENNGSFTVHYTNGDAKDWKKVENLGSVNFLAGTKTIFAADTSSKKMYVLKDGSAVSSWNWTADVLPVGAAGSYCVFENGLYTAAGASVAGAPTTDIKGICDGPNNALFVFDSSTLHCYNGSSWSKIAHKVISPQSITYLSRKKLVLIGGKNGYGEIQLTEGTDLAKAQIVTLGTDNSSVPPSNYHQYKNSVGKWLLNPIMAFDYDKGYIIYAGALDQNATYSGLWGFYSYGTQIEWNRE